MITKTDFGGEYSRSLSANPIVNLRTFLFVYPEKTDNGYQVAYQWDTSASNPEQQAVLDHANVRLSYKTAVIFDSADTNSFEESIRTAIIFCQKNYLSFFDKKLLMNGTKLIAELNQQELIVYSGSTSDNYTSGQLSKPFCNRLDNLRIRPTNINSPKCLMAMVDATLDAANAILKHAGQKQGRAVFPYESLQQR